MKSYILKFYAALGAALLLPTTCVAARLDETKDKAEAGTLTLKELGKKVDSLSAQVSGLPSKVGELASQVQALQGLEMLVYLSLALSVLSLVISVIVFCFVKSYLSKRKKSNSANLDNNANNLLITEEHEAKKARRRTNGTGQNLQPSASTSRALGTAIGRGHGRGRNLYTEPTGPRKKDATVEVAQREAHFRRPETVPKRSRVEAFVSDFNALYSDAEGSDEREVVFFQKYGVHGLSCDNFLARQTSNDTVPQFSVVDSMEEADFWCIALDDGYAAVPHMLPYDNSSHNHHAAKLLFDSNYEPRHSYDKVVVIKPALFAKSYELKEKGSIRLYK